MLACLLPTVCSKTAAGDEVLRDGQTKVEPSKQHGISFFTCQFKQMASRLTGASLCKSKCKPVCGKSGKVEGHDDNPAVHPAPSEMHSPQFSLKSYQMNGHTPTRDDQIADTKNQFAPSQESPKALRSLHKNFAEAALGKGEGEDKADLSGSGYKVFNNEWVAQVERGVYITFCAASDGFNDLKRIRFSRAMFSKPHAENWWTENCPRVRALYNVRPPYSPATDDDRLSMGYATPDSCSKSPTAAYNGGDYLLMRRKSSADARLKEDDKSNDDSCMSWIEQDEAGVYLTIITVPGGKQLKRVRFSRENFSEGEAAAWWEHNRQRIYAQYIFRNTRLQGK